jgi:flagellar biosynthetic protein FlhB
LAEDKFENTEQATPRKLDEAREKGQVAKSKEIPSAAIILATIVVFYFFGVSILGNLLELSRGFFIDSATMEITASSVATILKRSAFGVFLVMMPFMILPIVGLAANIMHIGFIFSAEPLVPKFSKVNPWEGLKRLFSPSTGVELIKNLLKLIVMGYLVYTVLNGEVRNFGQLAVAETNSMLVYLARTSLSILIKTSFVIVIIAVLDFAFQRWEWARNLKMSKHEVKEEFKDTEGQPLVKARIKTLQRQIAMQRMMHEVPEATVVVTNPKRYAIAIKYVQGEMEVPVVVAKGAGIIAQNIRELAKENGVPLVENKPLARTLWKLVEIGSEVPHTLFQAIAEVLAFVYKLKAGSK